MATTDDDLQIIDRFLDGELSADEVGLLRLRLATEPLLQQALDREVAARSLRTRAMARHEGDDAALSRLVAAVQRTIDRDAIRDARAPRWRTWVARAGTVAACLAMGFVAGAIYQSDPRQPMPADAPDAVATTDPSRTPLGPRAGAGGGVVQVSNAADRQPYQVTLRDARGEVFAVYRFDTEEQARRFASDVNTWQQRPRGRTRPETLLTSEGF